MNAVKVNVLHARAEAIRPFFNLTHCAELLMRNVEARNWSTAMAAHFRDFNFEWHIIPALTAVPFEEQ